MDEIRFRSPEAEGCALTSKIAGQNVGTSKEGTEGKKRVFVRIIATEDVYYALLLSFLTIFHSHF